MVRVDRACTKLPPHAGGCRIADPALSLSPWTSEWDFRGVAHVAQLPVALDDWSDWLLPIPSRKICDIIAEIPARPAPPTR